MENELSEAEGVALPNVFSKVSSVHSALSSRKESSLLTFLISHARSHYAKTVATAPAGVYVLIICDHARGRFIKLFLGQTNKLTKVVR